MFPNKKIRTQIRKILGLIREGEIVENPIVENSKERYDYLFKNKGFLKGYIEQNRLNFYKELIEYVEKEFIFLNSKNIADIGCGTGHLLHLIHQKYSSIDLFGTDFSESAIELTNKIIPFAKTELYDIYTKNLNFIKRFQLVFSTEVLEHLLYPEIALNNLLEILAVQGTLVLTVPNGRNDTYSGHINFWSPESWEVFIKNKCSEELYDLKFFLIENKQTNMVIIRKKF